MNNLYTFYILFLLLPNTMLYAGAGNDFLECRDAYLQKNYQQAYDKYLTLTNKSPAVWYNLGNCAYHLGNYEQALLLWKKARYGLPYFYQARIEHNNAQAYTKLEQEYKPSSWNLQKWQLYAYFLYFPLWILQIILLISLYSFWLLCCFVTGKKMLWLKIKCLLSLFCAAILIGSHYWLHEQSYGLVKKHDAKVYVGPDERYHVIKELPFLTALTIEQCDNWCKIHWSEGVGWMLSDDIEKI